MLEVFLNTNFICCSYDIYVNPRDKYDVQVSEKCVNRAAYLKTYFKPTVLACQRKIKTKENCISSEWEAN